MARKDIVIAFVDQAGRLTGKTVGDIMNKTVDQFLQIEGALYRAVHDRVYDTVVYETNTSVVPGHKHSLFRLGLGDNDTYATSNTQYKKTLNHTNMLKGGEFPKNDLIIIKRIEVEFPQFGGKPGGMAAGEITIAKATFPATIDPALSAYAWLSQTWLEYKEEGDAILENKAIYFPQTPGLFAAYGANSGAYVQNGQGSVILPTPRVLEGGEDFSVDVTPLASTFDLTAATGLNSELKMVVAMDIIRVEQLRS